MNNIENLILPVTYNNWNSYTFSRTVEMLISFSADAGAIPLHYSHLYKNNPVFLYNNIDSPADYKEVKKDLLEIDRLDDANNDDFISYLERFVDIENEPLLDSNFKFTLPHAFRHSKVKDLPFTKISPAFRNAKWLGLLESYLDDTYSPVRNKLSYSSKSHEIDFFINEKIDGYIELRNSDNYIKSIVEHIAHKHNETIDINRAIEYFNKKPYQMVLLADQHGIKTVLENGFDLYSKFIADSFLCEVQNKPDTIGVAVRLLFNWDYGDSVNGYIDFCESLSIIPNFVLFEQWHHHMYWGIDTPESSTVNTIAKLITGHEFQDNNLDYFERAILDYAAREKFETTGDDLFKKWVSER